MAEPAKIAVEAHETAPGLATERGITFRSVAVGLSAVVLINLWATYAETVVRASRLNLSYFQLSLMAVFLVLVAVANPLLKLWDVRFAFSPSELLAIVAIGMVGSVVPGGGVTGILIGVISTPVYFATPENRWAEFYHAHLGSWVVPTDPEAARAFYEGLPPGAAVPWEVWLAPLGWWASLVLAVFAVSASAMVILRKQWSDNEKLVYPLVAVPMEMAQDARSEGKLPGFMRSKLFWIPAAAACSLFVWNTVSWSYPLVPLLDVFPHAGSFRFTRYSPNMRVEPMNLFTIGFAYFATTQVLFSIWFFFLVHIVEGTILNRLGYQIEQSTDTFSADPPTTAYQCFGALAVMVVWRLWMARHHLRDVFLKAINPRHPVDDSGEVLSYRTAVLVLLLGLGYVMFWLSQVGMDMITVVIFMGAVGVIYIGMARVVTEAGLVYSGATVTPQAFVMDMRGTYVLSPASLTGVVLSYSLVDYMRGLFTPGVAHSVKLGDLIRGNRRALLFWVGVSVLLGLAASVLYTLHLGYSHGAYNFPRRIFSGDPKGVYNSTLSLMRTPRAPDSERMVFFGIGGVLMALLTFLRYRFPGWPIHPIGLALSSADNMMHNAIPIFIAWSCKTTIMGIGGVRGFQKAKPVFIGLIVGYSAGVVWSFVVDAILWSGQGHEVHNW